MAIQNFLAKDFINRQYLEKYILAELGDNIEKNRQDGRKIEGTREELRRLQLDDLTGIYGIRCLITDEKTADMVKKNK